MLEKLKGGGGGGRKIISKPNVPPPLPEALSSASACSSSSSSSSSAWVESPQVQTVQSKLGRTRQLRDDRGITISQGVGGFPNEVTLRFRHDHPTLGLSDVAYQREHQSHRMTPAQYQALQQRLACSVNGGVANSSSANSSFSSSASSERPRVEISENVAGVLSLGLPQNLTLFKKKKSRSHEETEDDETDLEIADLNGKSKLQTRRRSLPRRLNKFLGQSSRINKRPTSAHGNLTSNATMAEDEGFTEEDGDSELPAIPPRAISRVTCPPNRGRPPQHLLMPRTFSPCPPTKMHPPLFPVNSSLAISGKGV